MKKLNAKKIKRHMLKTYEFWQLDEKFLIVPPDKKLLSLPGMEILPESSEGYLAYIYLDEVLQVVFLGPADPETDTYSYFDLEELPVVPASLMDQIPVRVVKSADELNSHPFVSGVLAYHASQALKRSTLALRSLDPLRDPENPFILTASFIRDEARKQKVWEEALEKDPQVAPPLDDDLINFVRIKDLTPSNEGTWRAVLLENLPGTRLKKKGDDVAISMVTVEEDERESTLLFVDHTAPVMGTDITVSAHKPSRLPWRLAYEVACSNCPYKNTFMLGRHGDDSFMFKEILDEIREGRVDPLILIDLVQRDDGELDFSRELYRCRNCGNLEVMKRLRLISPDKTLSASYFCPECGERMSQMRRGHIASVNCPDCRNPLDLVSEKQWSGVPDPEGVQ